MVPLLLPLKAFPNAITWNRSVFQIAKMAGPVLGGFLVAWVDFATVYLLNAVFALIMCIILVSISFDRAQKRPIESPTWGSLLEGVRFVHQHKAILAVISIDMLAILLGGTRALLPIYADSILGIGAVGLGWLRGAEGVGAFVAALFLAHAPPMKKPGVIIIWSVAFFGMATLAFGVSSTLLLSLGMLFLMGAFDNISAVVRQCVVQLMSPDALRGRVAAVNSIFIGSSNELGAIRAGFMAALIGPVAAVAVGAIGTVASAVVVARVWPALGKIGDLSRLRAK
jgi:predicted MFS family arabinose efflux permease